MEEATWESEEIMRQQYPQLFELGKFRGRNFFLEGKNCNTLTLGSSAYSTILVINVYRRARMCGTTLKFK